MNAGKGRYLRVSASRSRPLADFGLISGFPVGRNLTVVDLDFRSRVDLALAWDAIHDVPDRLADSDDVVFIWPEMTCGPLGADAIEPIVDFRRQAVDRARALGAPRTISVLAHRVGHEPVVISPGEVPTNLPRLVRSLELLSLIAEGGAEITPSAYHFRLPSGNHARSFIRLANALRSPRDIWSLTAWLSPRLDHGVGLVTDTATLAPILTQARSFADLADVELGPTVVLDRYPRSRLEVSQAVEEAATDGSASAMLSVSSSGMVRGYFEDALDRYAPGEWTIDVVVDVRGEARRVPPSIDQSRDVWTELESAPLSNDVAQCGHCASPKLAPVVRIDERSFLPLAEPAPELYMPSLNQGANHAFWELADSREAVRVEALPSVASPARAERVPLGVKIDLDRLVLDSEAVGRAISSRLADLERDGRKSALQRLHDTHVARAVGAAGAATVVYCGDPPLRRDAVVDALSHLGVDTARVHFSSDELRGDPCRSPDDSVLCFSLGSVTGASLKRLRIEASDCYAGSEPAINGLCLHARPPTVIEWEAIMNAFRPCTLAALWLSYLPWTSPLRTELELLERAGTDGHALGNRRSYLRSTETAGADGAYLESALLGANQNFGGQLHVRERSIYGLQLGATTAYAAMGAAVHARRLEHAGRRSAQRFMVDLPKVARSYFDAILMASVLRWTKPGEAWWGEDPSEEQETMRSLLRSGSSTAEEAAVLYPELLLAAALGKIPAAALDALTDSFDRLRRQYPPDADDSGPFRSKRFALAEEVHTLLDQTRQP